MKPNVSEHWVSMSGMRGCIPEHLAVSPTRAEAVSDLSEVFGHVWSPRTFQAKFGRGNDYVEFPDDVKAGAQYAEVTRCDCEQPWLHQDEYTDKDAWLRHYGKDFGFSRRSDDIKLHIMTTGDRSVGIQGGSYTIICEGLRPAINDDPEYRKGVREIFAEAAVKVDDFPVEAAWFDDECAECGTRLPEDNKCPVCSDQERAEREWEELQDEQNA